MTRRYLVHELIGVIGGDREFFEQAVTRGVIEARGDSAGGATAYAAVEVERVRVARTLVRDLDVNWEGVEIILRMREELLATRRQILELITTLREQASEATPDDSGDDDSGPGPDDGGEP